MYFGSVVEYSLVRLEGRRTEANGLVITATDVLETTETDVLETTETVTLREADALSKRRQRRKLSRRHSPGTLL